MKSSLEALRGVVVEQCQAIDHLTESVNTLVKHGVVDKSCSAGSETRKDKAGPGGNDTSILKEKAQYAHEQFEPFHAENMYHRMVDPFPPTRQERIFYEKKHPRSISKETLEA